MEITDQSFNIVDIKPANMEELTEVRIRVRLNGLCVIRGGSLVPSLPLYFRKKSREGGGGEKYIIDHSVYSVRVSSCHQIIL